MLERGKDCLKPITERSWQDYIERHSKTPWAAHYGKMDNKDDFDAAFFGISPKEAEAMDYGQRLLLEDAYKALEDAGIAPSSLQKRAVGVFIGSVGGGARGTDISEHALLGADSSLLPARIAYFMDLKGPALTVNTACSSSLVAMDIACQYLRSGQIELAIVGGVTVYANPHAFVAMHSAGILSPTGRCRPFDDGANGMVVGDGSAVTILKRLEDAERDHDPIHGVIAAIGVNQNGQTAGISVPSYLSQSALQTSLYRAHRIDVERIQYIETHGTATKLGDPIEIDALKRTFRQFTSKRGYCAIGSVKANIGHTAAASGVMSVIKVLLCLKNRSIPPTLNFEKPNQYIDFSDSPFFVNTTVRPWPENSDAPRMAAVTSLGHGGANVHAVVQEYRSGETGINRVPKTDIHIVPLSAKTPSSLLSYAKILAEFIRRSPSTDFLALAYTLQVGRDPMRYRSAILAGSPEELAHRLQSLGEVEVADTLATRPDGAANPAQNPGAATRSLNPEELARRWNAGERIDWLELYPAEKPPRLHLPTYVFGRSDMPEVGGTVQKSEPKTLTENCGAILKRTLTDALAAQLACPAGRVESDKSFFELGLNSLGIVALLKTLERLTGIKLSSGVLFEYRTVNRLSQYLQDAYGAQLKPTDIARYAEAAKASPILRPNPQFPELISLNAQPAGNPAFWFHGGLGGVQPYHILAEASARPFYGIQARGWMDEGSPIVGVEAMAAYYIRAVRAIQPHGPYDLGGYSLGGLLAYEVARQLQEAGESIATIVMLDTFDTRALEPSKPSLKNDYLQAVNIALQTTVMQDPQAFERTLVHRDELDCDLDDEAFLQRLIAIARTRGFPYDEKHIYALIRRQSRVQSAHQAHLYKIPPLPQPESATCHYFRNKNGKYMGDLTPYFVLQGYEYDLDNMKHWEIWQDRLPRFFLVDIDVSNHLTFLSEPASCKTLIDFIRILYSESGMTTAGYAEFRIAARELHGTRQE